MNVISESEILDAIREASALTTARPEGAFTTTELADAWQVNRTTVHKRVAPLVRSGKMECIRIVESDITGRTQHVPAYRLVQKGKR